MPLKYTLRSIICFFVILTSILPQTSFAEPAIWKVEGKNNLVYLFGSIHVANKAMYPLGEKVESAFKQSDILVVEVDENKVDQVKVQQLMMSKGFYPGTETIADHINADTLKLLQKLLAETGIPYVTVARMRPGIIALTLTVAKIIKLGYTPELGIDRYFVQRAQGKKQIQQLETTEQQMELLLSFSDDDLLLKQTLVSLDKMEAMVNDLMQSWKNGDTSKMVKLMLTDQIEEFPEFEKILKHLINDRNVTMAVKIQNMLSDDKNYFVVVGAGHLIGDKSIVSILKKNGLSITRL